MNKQTINGKTFTSNLSTMITIGNKNFSGALATAIVLVLILGWHFIFVVIGYFIGAGYL